MTPKLQAVCEKLAREQPVDTLKLLLKFEVVGHDQFWRYCCGAHPYEEKPHGTGCPLDKLLKSIGLPDQETRKAMRKELRIREED